jgi:hypothetical protein
VGTAWYGFFLGPGFFFGVADEAHVRGLVSTSRRAGIVPKNALAITSHKNSLIDDEKRDIPSTSTS